MNRTSPPDQPGRTGGPHSGQDDPFDRFPGLAAPREHGPPAQKERRFWVGLGLGLGIAAVVAFAAMVALAIYLMHREKGSGPDAASTPTPIATTTQPPPVTAPDPDSLVRKFLAAINLEDPASAIAMACPNVPDVIIKGQIDKATRASPKLIVQDLKEIGNGRWRAVLTGTVLEERRASGEIGVANSQGKGFCVQHFLVAW